MKKQLLFHLAGVLIILNIIPVYGQSNNWNTLNEKGFSIQYPKNWELNNTGQYGTSFILLSQLATPSDKFKENVNLVIQDLSAYSLDLNQYVEISEKQIETMITDGKIISTERISKNGKEFQKVIYTGKQGVYNLKFEQFYWVLNKKAYILTLTCETTEFNNYKDIGEKILNSFKIN